MRPRLRHIELSISHTRICAYGADGEELSWFRSVMYSLGDCHNTRIAVARGAAYFGDYLYEAFIIAAEDETQVSEQVTSEIVASYRSYLVDADESVEYFARRVAERIPHPKYAANTLNSYLSAAGTVCRVSELLRRQEADLVAAGFSPSVVGKSKLFATSNERKPLPLRQKIALMEHSAIAQVLARAPEQIHQATFSQVPVPYDMGVRLDFPHEYSVALLESEPNPVYRAYFAGCFATGGRPIEVKQLLFEDLKPQTGDIELVNPATRLSHPAYARLLAYERKRLCWKGRNTRTTIALAPYVDIFWESYTEMLRLFPRKDKFDFAFTLTKGVNAGKPMFLGDHKTLNEAFRAAVVRIGLEVTSRTSCLYTMRHHYGVYMVNDFPCRDGTFGLPLATVMNAMGHVSERNTKKYARLDMDEVKIEVAFAMDSRLGDIYNRDAAAHQLAIYKAKVEKFEERLARLKNG